MEIDVKTLEYYLELLVKANFEASRAKGASAEEQKEFIIAELRKVYMRVMGGVEEYDLDELKKINRVFVGKSPEFIRVIEERFKGTEFTAIVPDEVCSNKKRRKNMRVESIDELIGPEIEEGRDER